MGRVAGDADASSKRAGRSNPPPNPPPDPGADAGAGAEGDPRVTQLTSEGTQALDRGDSDSANEAIRKLRALAEQGVPGAWEAAEELQKKKLEYDAAVESANRATMYFGVAGERSKAKDEQGRDQGRGASKSATQEYDSASKVLPPEHPAMQKARAARDKYKKETAPAETRDLLDRAEKVKGDEAEKKRLLDAAENRARYSGDPVLIGEVAEARRSFEGTSDRKVKTRLAMAEDCYAKGNWKKGDELLADAERIANDSGSEAAKARVAEFKKKNDAAVKKDADGAKSDYDDASTPEDIEKGDAKLRRAVARGDLSDVDIMMILHEALSARAKAAERVLASQTRVLKGLTDQQNAHSTKAEQYNEAASKGEKPESEVDVPPGFNAIEEKRWLESKGIEVPKWLEDRAARQWQREVEGKTDVPEPAKPTRAELEALGKHHANEASKIGTDVQATTIKVQTAQEQKSESYSMSSQIYKADADTKKGIIANLS